jgi:hypothetical protein
LEFNLSKKEKKEQAAAEQTKITPEEDQINPEAPNQGIDDNTDVNKPQPIE